MNLDSAISILFEKQAWEVQNEVSPASGTHLIGKLGVSFNSL